MKKKCYSCNREKADVIGGMCDECVESALLYDDLAWLTGTGRYGQ